MSGNDILSRIQILLDADTAKFEQGMRDADESSKSAFDNIRDNANKMGGWVAGAASVAVGSLVAVATAQAEQANEIEKAAYKAQSGTTEIQKYAVAAKQVGIELDQLGDLYKDFNEKAGEFVTVGGGGMVDFMEQVALKTEGSAAGAMKLAKQIASLSGPEAMGLYVKKMEEANLSQDQMSFLMESVASDSTMLLQIYKNNSEQVKLWGDALERSGAILDEQGIKKAAEFRTQSALLEMQLTGMKTQLVQAVIPAFVDIADAFQTGDEKVRAMAHGGEVLANVLRGVAAIAIGVYTTVNLVANSLAGLTANAITSYNAVNQAAQEKGGFWNNLPGVKLFKTSVLMTMDVQNPEGITAEMMDKNARIAEQGANQIIQATDNAVSHATAKMSSLYSNVNQSQSAATKGVQDWIDKQNKAANDAKKAAQALEQRKAQERLAIEYENADRLKKINMDLAKDISRVQKAGFRADSQLSIINMLKAQSSLARQLWIEQFNYELNEFQYTEEEKLKYRLRINELIIDTDKELDAEQKDFRIQSLQDQYKYEVSLIKAATEQRLFDAQQSFLSETQIMQRRYQLERDEIARNTKLAQGERDALIAASIAKEAQEKFNSYSSAAKNWTSIQANMGGTGSQYSLLQDRESKYDASSDLFNAEIALAESAEQREAIWQAHNDRMIAIDEQYYQLKDNIALTSAQNELGTMTDVWGKILGEQSTLYKTMAAASKAFAVYQALINVPKTYSDTFAAISAVPLIGPYIAMPMAAAAAATQVAQATMIKGVNLTGQAHEGLDKVPETGTWLLEKGERVVTEKTSAKLDQTLDKVNTGGQQVVNIYTDQGLSVEQQQNENGSLDVFVRKVSREVAKEEVRRGFSNLGNTNSYENKQIQRNFNTTVKR